MPSQASRRMTLANYETGEPMEAQYNPSQATIELEAFYSRLKTPGQSHEEAQYGNTGNTHTGFTLLFDGLAVGAPNLLDVQAYLLHLHHPPQNSASVAKGAPPGVLLSWPGWIAMLTFSPKVKITATRFDVGGAPTYLRVDVELEERRTRRLGAELVRRIGLRRAS